MCWVPSANPDGGVKLTPEQVQVLVLVVALSDDVALAVPMSWSRPVCGFR
ncbi:MAG: hypothetical protein ACREMA_01920 [Longimicrobiales bacterium]